MPTIPLNQFTFPSEWLALSIAEMDGAFRRGSEAGSSCNQNSISKGNSAGSPLYFPFSFAATKWRQRFCLATLKLSRHSTGE